MLKKNVGSTCFAKKMSQKTSKGVQNIFNREVLQIWEETELNYDLVPPVPPAAHKAYNLCLLSSQ